MIIGLIGSSNLKNLMIKEFTSDKYSFIDLEPNKSIRPTIINKVYKMIYFLKGLKKIDVLYCIFIRKSTWLYTRMAKILNKKVVYHWVGTDLYNVQLGKYKFGMHDETVDIHCAYANNLHDELKDLGIDSFIFPIVPIDIDCSSSIMPLRHAVLISIPDDTDERAEFYGYNETIELIKAFPTIPFYITRSTHPEKYNYPNAIYMGQISPTEMNELYNKISIVIRLPKHDGQSLLLMEGTIKGKYLIYNHQMPYTIHVDSTEEAVEAIKRIISDRPILQEEERNYGLDNYNVAACKNRFDYLISLL